MVAEEDDATSSATDEFYAHEDNTGEAVSYQLHILINQGFGHALQRRERDRQLITTTIDLRHPKRKLEARIGLLAVRDGNPAGPTPPSVRY